MIAHVFGTIVEKVDSALIVDVHGVGYEVQVTLNDFDTYVLEQEAKLYTHHHIREQAEELFGFSTLAAKRLFELLISVQGIGPKAALAILNLGPVEQVRSAMASGDSGFIQKAGGVGKRTAERVVVDLQDKVGLPAQIGKPIVAVNDDALDALMTLGYSLRQASEALEKIDRTQSVATQIREALKKAST